MQIWIFFRMAVLGHADMIFFSNGSSRPCRYEFFFQMAVLGHANMIFFQMAVLGHANMIFFQMAVLGHADMNFFSNGSSRPCRYDFFFQMAVLGHTDMIFFRKYKKNLNKKIFILRFFNGSSRPPYSYMVISTRVEIGKTRNCVETRRPQGGVFSHNFEFFQFSRVLI